MNTNAIDWGSYKIVFNRNDDGVIRMDIHTKLESIKEIDEEYGYYSVINIGRDLTCRMVLHGRGWVKESSIVVTVDEFIANYFQAYHDA